MIVTFSTANASDSICARRASASFFKVSTVAMRRTLPSSWRARSLFFRTISSAWSHGTSSRTTVNEPCTFGSSTTFRPLISWIRAEEVFQVDIFQVHRDRLARVLRAARRRSLRHLGFCSAARFTAGCEAAPCCSDALGFIATNSEAGLSANFAAASSAFTEGSTVGFAAAVSSLGL